MEIVYDPQGQARLCNATHSPGRLGVAPDNMAASQTDGTSLVPKGESRELIDHKRCGMGGGWMLLMEGRGRGNQLKEEIRRGIHMP